MRGAGRRLALRCWYSVLGVLYLYLPGLLVTGVQKKNAFLWPVITVIKNKKKLLKNFFAPCVVLIVQL
jgi:hypothetical protein